MIGRRRPETDDVLNAHAHACSSCSRKLVIQEALFESLELLESPPPPAGFSKRVVRTAQREQVVGRRNSRVAWLAVAAGLTVMLWTLAGRQTFDPPATQPATVLAESPETDQETLSSVLESPTVDVRLVGEGSLFADFSFVELSRQPREHVTHLAGGLRPVADSLTAALGVLRRTFPGGKSARDEKPQANYRLLRMSDLLS